MAKKEWDKRHLIARIFASLCMVTLLAPIAIGVAVAEEQTTGDAYLEGSYVEGEMLVVFNDSTSTSTAMCALGSIDVADESNLPDESTVEDSLDYSEPVVVKLEDGVSVEEAVREANADPAIAYAQPNFIYTLPNNEEEYAVSLVTFDVTANDLLQANLSARYIPNDPALQSLTSSHSANAWQLANIGAFDAWDIARTDDAVTVCVLDTGCYMNHEDLEGRLWTEYAYNAYNGTTLTCDYNGHGTHVAGCVAATANNGVGTAGASYNAKVLPICVFDTAGKYCYTDKAVAAYNYLLKLAEEHPEMNIRVVNMSFGGYGDKDDSDIALEQAIAKAKDKGIVSCAAGGNGDDDNNPITDPNYPSDYENVISVTALSKDGVSPTTWCDYNESKDICAPGELIYSTYSKGTKSYAMMSGTSQATPVVSGCLALMFAANPDLTPDEAEAAIKNTAKPITVVSGREGLYGAGRIDLAAAVEEVASGESLTASVAYEDGVATVTTKHLATPGTYKWQYSVNGSTWFSAGTTSEPSKAIAGTELNASRQWRVVVTGADGQKAIATFSVTQTELDVRVDYADGVATATVTGLGSETATYKWQYSNDGTSWYAAGTTTEPTKAIAATDKNQARQWRIIVKTDTRSCIATFRVVAPHVTVVYADGVATASVIDATATVTKYKWQYSNDGTSWYAAGTTTEPTKAIAATDKNKNRQWRVIAYLSDDTTLISTFEVE